jgi:DNA polymerase III delta prime subunit
MANSKKAHHSKSATGNSPELVRQILDGLRRRAAAKLKLDADSEEEGVAIAEKSRPNMRLTTDRAAYGIALGYCLAPYFPTMKALVASKAFVLIRGRVGDDPSAIGDALVAAVVWEAENVAHNPYSLGSEERFLVMSDVALRHSVRSVPPIAQAAERGVPVFGTLSADDKIPDALAGADLELHLPPMTPEMLALLFEATHDEVPADVLKFTFAEKLRTENLVAHVRRGRSAAECLAGLQQVVLPPPAPPVSNGVRLEDLAGYGEAKTWGLELAQDLKLWRDGKLSWDEVDHRGGVLAGPPGTGKTSFAGALAATLEVPLIASNVAEWNGHKHLSGTLNRMKEVFAEAVAKAPCVLLIDELDGISSRAKISGDHVEYWTQIVNLMLVLVTEAMNTPGVVIVGATNHVDRIDPALTRAGRLDRTVHIALPDTEAIAAIIARYAGFAARDLAGLANRLVGQTGADIEKLVRTAKASARRAGRPFSVIDIEAQVPDPLDKLAPRTRRRIAIYRNAQRIVAEVLGLAEMVVDTHDFSQQMEKRLSEERFYTEQTCNDVLAVIMAGRAGEEIVLGDVSTFGGCVSGSDLALATRIASNVEFKAGFGECGVIYLDGADHGPALSPTTGASVRRRIEGALARASAVLLQNVEELERIDGRTFGSGQPGPSIRLLN